MRYELEVNGRLRHVEVRRATDGFVVVLDDRTWVVDAQVVGREGLSLIARLDAGAPAEIAGREAGAASSVGGASHDVTIVPDDATGQLTVSLDAVTVSVGVNSRRRAGAGEPGEGRTGPQRLVAPMPGKIVRVLVQVGDVVRARQPLVVIEAMKMENELRARSDGRVVELHGREGQSVDAGTLLAVVGEL